VCGPGDDFEIIPGVSPPESQSLIAFRDGLVDSGDGGVLERAMRAELAVLYAGLEVAGEDMPKAGPADLNPPNGVFLVGYEGSHAVCCGGIKTLEPGVCEFKRMYVVPDLRGRGVARALLGALEDRARQLGFHTARLDTGDRQPAAQHIYESAGYEQIENFNANPVATFFGQKQL
jgi:GNAT superfamily N-acetyltransferase